MGAFFAWFAMASLAVAGFAAFTPETTPVTTATTETTVAAAQTAPQAESDIGTLAGRVAAMNFATSNIYATGESAPNVQALIESQVAEVASTTASTTPPTTVPPPPTTAPEQTPPTTGPPQTTTTTAPPTTTTVPETTTTTVGTTVTYPAPSGADQDAFDALVVGPWAGLVEAHFAPSDAARALQVIWCESRGDASATNGSSGAAGLFQHLPRFWEERSTAAGIPGANIYEPTANATVAAWLVYQGGGWKHWYPSAHCWG